MTDTTTENRSPVATTLGVVPRWIHSTVERLARTWLGQFALRHLDKLLWIVQKSAEWSLPRNEIYSAEDISGEGEEPSEGTEHVRPLPWIIFLPGILILRCIRVGLNVGAFVLGTPRIESITVVRFVQKNRRHLRCLRGPNGSSRTRSQDKRLSMNEAKRALIRSIRLTLSTLSCLDGSKPSLSPPPTRIHVSALDLDVAPTPEERSPTESAESPKPTAEREDIVEEISSDSEFTDDEPTDETLKEKIERLALENSTEDADFFPTASSTFSSEDNELESNVSMNELRDITDECYTMFETKIYISKDEMQQKECPREQETSDKKEDCDKAECDLSPHSSDSREYRTPSRLSQEGEGPFYSPTSSKTGSPDRTVSSTNVKNSQQMDNPKTNEFGNGEVRFASESTTSGRPHEETNNIAEKRNTNANKHHHRGKRMSHGNRKKK